MLTSTLRTALPLLTLVALAPLSSPAAASYSLTLEGNYASEYVFRGLEQQDAAFQPAVTFTKDSLTLGVWASEALTRKSLAWARGNEIDLWGTYGLKVDDHTTFTAGGTAYLYPSARNAFGEPRHTWELSAGLSRTIRGFAASATWYHDFKLRCDTIVAAVSRSLALPRNAGTIDFGAYYATNNIRDANGGLPGSGGLDYRYFGADLVFSRALSSTLTFKAGAHFVGVDRLSGAPDNLWFNLCIATSL